MRATHKLQQVMCIVVVCLFFFNFLPMTAVAASPSIDDGIWTDDFTDQSSTTRTNCTWESTGFIHLATNPGHKYNFADDTAHRAAYYRSIVSPIRFSFLFSPTRKPGVELMPLGYDALKNTHTHEEQNQYVNTSTVGLARYAIQLFRFQLDVTADTVGNITITWKGRIQSATSLSLCYWKKQFDNLPGKWIIFNSTTTPDKYLTLKGTLIKNDSKYAVDTDRYFYVAAILQTPQGAVGKLSTDYIEVVSQNENEYVKGPAYVTSVDAINYSGTKPYWELLAWEGYHSNKSEIRLQVLAPNGTGVYVPVSNSTLPGNGVGFLTSPVNLSSLSYNTIRLRAILTTDDTTQSPELYSWTLVWQRDKTQWQDLFSSEYRIDTKKSLNIDGKVNLSTVKGEWPMAGQNPANTRAAEGRGPLNDTQYWYSSIHESTNVRMPAPVLDGDSLYLAYTNVVKGKGFVYRYAPVVVPTENIGSYFREAHVKNFTHYTMEPIVASSAVTDNYLIVPTGQIGAGGVPNKIYFFDKNDPTKTPFFYLHGSSLSYWSSPIAVGNTLYITTWSGDLSKPNGHNMILAVDFASTAANKKWNQTLPAWSFSTPAYSDGIVVAGCHNTTGNSLFAYNATTGHLEWSADVGAIDRASPVVANGVVYIVSEVGTKTRFSDQTRLSALRLNNGSLIWNKTLGKKVSQPLFLDLNDTLADCTPAYADGMLYLTTPDGQLIAVNAKSGTITWPKSVYSYSRTYGYLKSSPAFADDVLYIGTPDGYMAAYNAGNGSSLGWTARTYSTDQNIYPVVSNPVVSNGLVYYCAANGWVFTYGGYIPPNEHLSGSLISIPIRLPTNYWWSRFFVNDNYTINKNNITYSILDGNSQFIRTIKDGEYINSATITLPRTLRLKAEFNALNYTVNPTLYNWTLTFTTDTNKPFINRSTLQPPIPKGGWIHEIIPAFSMKVKDNGTGLLVTSASCTLGYYHNATNVTTTRRAQLSGTNCTNGTTKLQNFTVNLTQWPEYANITSLKNISFNIMDLAGNKAFYNISFFQDNLKPKSWVWKKSLNQTYTKPVYINATAVDNKTAGYSGIASVTLYYRSSPTSSWTKYATFNGSKNPHWTFAPSTGSHYELMTRATDNASNVEDEHKTADANFTYDAKAPDVPTFPNISWYHDAPTFSVIFHDDYRLNTIQYAFYDPPRLIANWTIIASHINQSTYIGVWTLPDFDWNIMRSNTSYYLFFMINDTLGNMRLIVNTNEALQLRRDTDSPSVSIDLPSTQTFKSTTQHFNITALSSDTGGSGIQSLQLLYRYSSDDRNWTDTWTQYSENLSSRPYLWDFEPPNGEGYYQFQIVATDKAGNTAESPVASIDIQVLPTSWLVILGAVIVLFVIISLVLLIKWRKR